MAGISTSTGIRKGIERDFLRGGLGFVGFVSGIRKGIERKCFHFHFHHRITVLESGKELKVIELAVMPPQVVILESGKELKDYLFKLRPQSPLGAGIRKGIERR